MMSDLQDIQSPIASELETYREQFRLTLQHDNPLLETALNHILKRSGKLVRPSLVFLSARLMGNVSEKVFNVAL